MSINKNKPMSTGQSCKHKKWIDPIIDRKIVNVGCLIEMFRQAVSKCRNYKKESLMNVPGIIGSYENPHDIPNKETFYITDNRSPGDPGYEKIDEELEILIKDSSWLQRKYNSVSAKIRKEKYQKPMDEMHSKCITIMNDLLDSVNTIIHDSHSRFPRVMYASEFLTLKRHCRRIRFLEQVVPNELLTDLFAQFIDRSNLARKEGLHPVVPIDVILYPKETFKTFMEGTISEEYSCYTQWMAGDDEKQAVWTPSAKEVERIRSCSFSEHGINAFKDPSLDDRVKGRMFAALQKNKALFHMTEEQVQEFIAKLNTEETRRARVEKMSADELQEFFLKQVTGNESIDPPDVDWKTSGLSHESPAAAKSHSDTDQKKPIFNLFSVTIERKEEDDKSTDTKHTCFVCRAYAKKKCCGEMYYCSEKCQNDDWKRHKKECLQSPAAKTKTKK